MSIWKSSRNNLVDKIAQWHHDRNLIEGSTDKDQYMKLIQEAGELSDNICKGQDIRDDIGDMMVVLINIMTRNELTMEECLQVAYDDIKDRKGKMIDGVFVKEGDMQPLPHEMSYEELYEKSLQTE
jgi:NTP pyrophosphatase (non-canonical NTP hydrolase)|tara:strand:- start:4191 stop:4568 length:378 start_codon:yes stop_codon:yes gene_type:complete